MGDGGEFTLTDFIVWAILSIIGGYLFWHFIGRYFPV